MCCQRSDEKLFDNLCRPLEFESLDRSLWNDKCDYIDVRDCSNLNPDNYNLIALQHNIRSLIFHQVELRQLLHGLERRNSRIDIMILCETFLTDLNIKLVNIPRYISILNHRKNSKGGGVAILIRNESHTSAEEILMFSLRRN